MALTGIHDEIFQYLRRISPASIMLTGGRSAEKLYSSWASSVECMSYFAGTNLYFGDERCVSPTDLQSNHNLVMRSLFPKGLPSNIFLHRMEADSLNLELAANNYSKLLPKSIDLLMLSVGEDGHISSLFPHSPVLHELQRSVVPVVGFKPPFSRLTITPQVIQSARNIIVIAEGIEKRKIYEKALQDPEDIDSIPARLVLNRTWVFD